MPATHASNCTSYNRTLFVTQEYKELTQGRIKKNALPLSSSKGSVKAISKRPQACKSACPRTDTGEAQVLRQLRDALTALQPIVRMELQRVHVMLAAQTQTEQVQGLPCTSHSAPPLAMAVAATGLVPRSVHPNVALQALAAQPSASPAVLTHLETYSYHVKSSRSALATARARVNTLARTVHYAVEMCACASKQNHRIESNDPAVTDDSSGSASSFDSLPFMEGLSRLHHAVQGAVQGHVGRL
jgi:hypothetical protein